MKIKLLVLFFFLITYGGVAACPVCEKQQPELLRGITHGIGPQSNWDWLIIGVMLLVTLFVLFYSIKFLVKPGERSDKHIKQSVLQSF